jgi:hypothetical protein
MGAEVVTRARRARLCAAIVVATGLASSAARAAVTLTASRPDVLYSADGDPKCSELSQLADDKLPLNVIRLRATVDNATGPVRYHWSIPHPQMGILAADLNLGPAEETAAIRGLCAEFGNACILTPDKLPFYNQPTILWIAPTCEALPSKSTRNFPGGTVRIGVTVTEGKKKLGKSTSQPLGFGRAASATLFMDGRDGVGVSGGLPSDINPFFGAVVSAPGIVLPPGGAFEFDTGEGASATLSGCFDTPPRGDIHPYSACTGRLLYQHAGKFIASVKEKFDDGSALCDNLTVHVLSATIVPKLAVTTTPRGNYTAGQTVHLTVTMFNDSPVNGGSGILLIGGNVLTCTSDLVVAGTHDSRMTTFDLQHCSETAGQGCTQDSECRPPFCPECGDTEVCLLASHCSQTLDSACMADGDCEAPTCPKCQDGETCTQVLATPAIGVEIGQAVNLVDKDVVVTNLFPSPARIVDAWTVNTFNAGSADASLHYKIKPLK